MPKIRMMGPLALFTVAGLVLAGCSNADVSTSATDGEAAADANYVIAIAQDFQGVDRASFASEASKTLGDIQQSRLLNLSKSDEDADSCMDDAPTEIDDESPLVQSWAVTDDGMGIDIVLKDGVQSAAGNVLTSADVVWTIDRIKALDAGAQTLWFTVGGFDEAETITVTDDTHFRLNLTEPSALAPYALAGVAGIIHDSTAAQAQATADDPWAVAYLTDHTANFGPWDLTSFGAQQLVFSRNENYQGERGNVSTVTVQTVTDASARIQLVQSGQASETNGLDYTQLASLESGSGVNVVECASSQRDWLGLNAADPIVGNTQVREAISLALDREAIAASIYQGFADPSSAGLSQAFGVDEGENYTQDVEQATSLLAEAGYADGFTLTLSVSPAQPGTYSQSLAALIQQQLAAVGITVEIETVPSATDFRSQGLDRSMQAWLMAETPAFANAGYSGWITNADGGLQNYAGYSDADLNDLTASLMADGAGDEAATQELSDLIDTLQPAIYLVDKSTYFVRATCVESVPTSTLAFDLAGSVTTCGQ
ncbi:MULTISPECIES: ABC transporter substrate-binding protein [unclassified Modestobacter]